MCKGNLKPTLFHFKYVLNFPRIPTTTETNNPCKGGWGTWGEAITQVHKSNSRRGLHFHAQTLDWRLQTHLRAAPRKKNLTPKVDGKIATFSTAISTLWHRGMQRGNAVSLRHWNRQVARNFIGKMKWQHDTRCYETLCMLPVPAHSFNFT